MGATRETFKGWIHTQYGIRTEGGFSVPELQNLDRQLGAWSHVLGKERFKELLAAGAAYNYPNDMFAFRREDSLDTGWVDSEGRVRINRETFDPGGRYRNFGDFLQKTSEPPYLVVGHEIAHIIRDGLVRAGNTDLTTQYAARLGRDPLHHDTDPNENLATGLALYVLAQAGLVSPQPNAEYDNVLRFMATVAIPALKHANRNRRPEPHGRIE